MLVDVAGVLLGGAEDRLNYAQREYLADRLTYVDDPALRAYYLRNRLLRAVELIRVYWTKVPR